MYIFKPFTTKYHNLTFGTIIFNIPYSEHTYNNIDKPIDEGAMSTKSSTYIKWLINEVPNIHPAFALFKFLMRSRKH